MSEYNRPTNNTYYDTPSDDEWQGMQEFLKLPKTVEFRDGETAFLQETPGGSLDVTGMFYQEMNDGDVSEAIVTTESGSKYYLRDGIMIDAKKRVATDMYAQVKKQAEMGYGGSSSSGEGLPEVVLTVGEQCRMPDRITSPVKDICYTYLHREYVKPDQSAPENPFAKFREVFEAAQKKLRPEQTKQLEDLMERLD